MTSIFNYHVTGNSELTYMHVSGWADPESLQEGYMYWGEGGRGGLASSHLSIFNVYMLWIVIAKFILAHLLSLNRWQSAENNIKFL